MALIDYNDYNDVIKIVRKDGMNLKYTSEELQNNKEVVLTAINQNFDAIQYASIKLKNVFKNILNNNIEIKDNIEIEQKLNRLEQINNNLIKDNIEIKQKNNRLDQLINDKLIKENIDIKNKLNRLEQLIMNKKNENILY